MTIAMALAATPVASLLQVLPETYMVAFVVAATPFAVFGITSAFWAIMAGLLASLLAERRQLIDFWITDKG